MYIVTNSGTIDVSKMAMPISRLVDSMFKMQQTQYNALEALRVCAI